MSSNKPGIFVRLSNLIVIQVLFIFAALALILFYPEPERQIGSEIAGLEQRLLRVGNMGLCPTSVEGEPSATRKDLHSAFAGQLAAEKSIDYAAVVCPVDSGAFDIAFTYSRDVKKDVKDRVAQAIPTYYDKDMLRFVVGGEPGFIAQSVFGSHHSVYYNRLVCEDSSVSTPAVLVTVVNHGLLVSARSNLQYLLLILFLFSTLISLLTVNLVSKRFKRPLDRLIRGLEKTSEGELYYLIETEGDEELDRLSNAYNRMTQKLWNNQKELKKYNAKLKKSNISILESQLFLATLIDSSPLSIVVTNSAGEILIFNRSASDVFDYPAEDVMGQSIDMLFAQRSEQEPDSRDDSNEPSGLEVICKRKEGELFPAYVVDSPVVTQQGRQNARLYVLLDISESKNFQEMMIRLDRFCTRGEMAGDIAHEINNYLAVLMGNLELLPLLLKKGDSEKVDKKLDLMKTTVDRIARFANGLMDTPQEEVHFEPTSLNQVLENIIAFLKPQNKFDSIQITTQLSTDLPVLQVDQGQIQQLLVNLIYNASEALADQEGEKKIHLVTSVVELDGQRFAQVEVRDNGPGVLPEREPLLFNDRFTTKRKGHGIGLITCRRIMENYGGKVGYRRDHGAVFYFQIPDVPRTLHQKEPAVEASADSL